MTDERLCENVNDVHLIIDEGWREWNVSISPEERRQLKENILAEGCTHTLTVWSGLWPGVCDYCGVKGGIERIGYAGDGDVEYEEGDPVRVCRTRNE